MQKEAIFLLLPVILLACSPLGTVNKLYDAGDYDAAIAELSQIVAEDSTNAGAYYLLARSHMAQGHPSLAYPPGSRAHKLAPQKSGYRDLLSEINTALGDSLAGTDELRDAIMRYDAALELYPDKRELYLKKGDVYRRQAYLNKASEQYERAKASERYARRADSLLADVEAARKVARSLFDQGMAAKKKKRLQRAISKLEAAHKAHRDDSEIAFQLHLVRGQRYYRRGTKSKLWDAIEEFGLASTQRPDAYQPHYWMAKCYDKKDKEEFDNAIECYEKALALEPPARIAREIKRKIRGLKAYKEKLRKFWGK